MALGLPESNSSFRSGNQAIAQSDISELVSQSILLGDILTGVSILENLINYQSTCLVATNTREAANKQAISTLCRGLGAGIIGVFTLGSAFTGAIAERNLSKDLDFVGDKEEVETLRSYRDAAADRVSGRVATSGETEEQKLGDIEQKKRMDRLTSKQNYSEENLDEKRPIGEREISDREIITASEKDDADDLIDHLDSLINNKEQAMNTKRDIAFKKADSLARGFQGTGSILEAVAQGVGSYYYQQSGEKEASKAVAQATQGMAQSSQGDLGGQVNDAIRTAVQSSEINVSIAQGDNLSNN